MNCVNAITFTQVFWWTFWWTHDIFFAVSGNTLMSLPWCMIVVLLDYKTDVIHLRKFISSHVKDHTRPRMHINMITSEMRRLKAKARHVNVLASKVLFVVSLFTPAEACICLFIGLFSDVLVVRLLIPIIVVIVNGFLLFVQVMVGDVTNETERLLYQLSMLISKANVQHECKKELVMATLEIGTNVQSLAMYDVYGERYTTTSALRSLLETLSPFPMLLTFTRFLVYRQ